MKSPLIMLPNFTSNLGENLFPMLQTLGSYPTQDLKTQVSHSTPDKPPTLENRILALEQQNLTLQDDLKSVEQKYKSLVDLVQKKFKLKFDPTQNTEFHTKSILQNLAKIKDNFSQPVQVAVFDDLFNEEMLKRMSSDETTETQKSSRYWDEETHTKFIKMLPDNLKKFDVIGIECKKTPQQVRSHYQKYISKLQRLQQEAELEVNDIIKKNPKCIDNYCYDLNSTTPQKFKQITQLFKLQNPEKPIKFGVVAQFMTKNEFNNISEDEDVYFQQLNQPYIFNQKHIFNALNYIDDAILIMRENKERIIPILNFITFYQKYLNLNEPWSSIFKLQLFNMVEAEMKQFVFVWVVMAAE